jgi:hypothetical protein
MALGHVEQVDASDCPSCGGELIRCHVCDGDGAVPGPGVADWVRCGVCGGDGYLECESLEHPTCHCRGCVEG